MSVQAPRVTVEPEQSPEPKVMSSTVATLLVIAASLAMGSVPVFARELTDAGLSAVSVAFYRNLLGSVVLVGLLRFDSTKRRATLWGLTAGFAMGLGWMAYVRALEVVSVSTAGVIYMSYPMFAIVLAWALFRQKPGPRAVFSGVIILVAAIVALGAELNGDHADILLVAFAAPLSFGFAIAVLTERLTVLRPIERVAPIAAGSTIGLLPLFAVQPWDQAVPGDLNTWLLAIGIALLTAVGPQWIYSAAAPNVGAARAAVAGSVELPMMFLVGYAWFEEQLTVRQGIAGLLVLAAVLLVPSRQSPGITIVRRKHRLAPGRFYERDRRKS